MAAIEKLVKSARSILEGIYWALLILGVFSIWLGIKISPIEEVQFLAASLISIGSGLLAICLANFLQKLSFIIPRKKWVHKIGACNSDFVLYLLRCADCVDIKFDTVKSFNIVFKVNIRQQVFNPLTNIRKLEELMRRRRVDFLLTLKPRQLNQIQGILAIVNKRIDEVSHNYGRPVINNEFVRDLANLKDRLRIAVFALSQLSRKNLNPETIIITSKRSELREIASSIKPEVIMRVNSKHYTQAQDNPTAFWAIINLTEYLESLISFMNFYGYNNNVAASFVKSRASYISDKISRWLKLLKTRMKI